MLRNTSVATIAAPEFVNLAEDALNPGISKADVKVLYLGENRNGSFINKETAMKMSETLRACPIVGAYRKDIDDFGDHGEIIHIENGEITFDCATVPYGFVAPDAKVWFKEFTDYDEFGNTVNREYLMTTAYLWTGQYPEIERCVKEGMGQSMELDGASIDGHWAENSESGIEFFIINDASFTKLCVLGDGVEPCFEGASVEAPNISGKFSKEGFTTTLYNMMNELKFALAENAEKTDESESVVEETTDFAENQEEEVEETADEAVEFAENAEESTESTESAEVVKENLDQESDFSANTEEEKESEEVVENTEESADNEFAEKDAEIETLKSEIASLQEKCTLLEKEAEELRSYKASRISADKDALINKYNMLSDDDKAEIIANKDSYSYEEIESKLALLYVKKNVDFDDQEEEVPVSNEATLTFGLSTANGDAEIDPIIELLRDAANK
jgi:UPI00017B381E related cluster